MGRGLILSTQTVMGHGTFYYRSEWGKIGSFLSLMMLKIPNISAFLPLPHCLFCSRPIRKDLHFTPSKCWSGFFCFVLFFLHASTIPQQRRERSYCDYGIAGRPRCLQSITLFTLTGDSYATLHAMFVFMSARLLESRLVFLLRYGINLGCVRVLIDSSCS